MADFIIDSTNFGIDLAQSSFGLSKDADGRILLSVEIHGSQDAYDKASESEDSEWSWTLYPPYFYLGHQMPVNTHDHQRVFTLTSNDLEDADMALYMMEHNNVENIRLNVNEGSIEIVGRVDLMGEQKDFMIKWTK